MSNIGVRFTRSSDDTQFVQEMLSESDARKHASKFTDDPRVSAWEIVGRANVDEPWGRISNTVDGE